MTTAADIDALSSVRKFLERSVVISKEDETADRSEEVTALLETAALSFLLYPQVVLNLVLQARNLLYQVVVVERQLLEFLQDTLPDLGNPDEPVADTSYLVDAQTALLELGQLGRVDTSLQAYSRYQAAVQRFLDSQLSSTLKRHGRGEFERSGQEAREDLYSSYTSLIPLHGSMIGRLHDLAVSVASFQSVDLTQKISSSTISSVRDSLSKLIEQASILSKTVIAIELLSGTAALQSVSGNLGIYDPAVDTGTLPLGRTITISSEAVPARLLTTAGPWDLGGETALSLIIDGAAPTTVPFGTNLLLLASYPAPTTYVIPSGYKLWWSKVTGGVATIQSADLIAGTRTRAQIVSDLNTALGADGTWVDIGTLYLHSSTLDSLTILGYGEGTYSGGSYHPPAPSAHAILGFTDGQRSIPTAALPPAELARLLACFVTTALKDDQVELSSPTMGAASSLEATGAVATVLGIAVATEAEPAYLALVENGQEIDPVGVGVYVGSRVVVRGDRGLSALVTEISDQHLFFGSALPRGTGLSTTISPPLVVVVREMLTKLAPYDGLFDDDLFRLQGVLTPLLGKPTQAQINDAKRVIVDVLSRVSALENLLAAYVVPDDSQQFLPILKQLISGLEDRNLDRAVELLKRGCFSDFFGLTKDNASKGSRFMTAMEEVGKNELWTSTRESEIQEGKDVAVVPEELLAAPQ